MKKKLAVLVHRLVFWLAGEILDELPNTPMNPMTKKKKTSIEEFADTFRDNPKEIIAWAKQEIKEYQELIKILEKKGLKRGTFTKNYEPT
jgi:hypothetical protein